MGYNTHFDIAIEADSGLLTHAEIAAIITGEVCGETYEAAFVLSQKGLLTSGPTTPFDALFALWKDHDYQLLDDLHYAKGDSSCSIELHGKWYDWEADFRAASAACPTLIFTIFGNGEEDGDIWKAYFFAGKGYKQPAEVTFPPFDAGLMV